MQSHLSSKQKERIPLPLPWGFGSMSFQGRVWRLTWRDPAGNVQWTNSGTDDAAKAQRIMAELALPRARAMVAKLEAIANGETYQGPEPAGRGRRPRPGGAAVPNHSPSRRKASGPKTKGGRS